MPLDLAEKEEDKKCQKQDTKMYPAFFICLHFIIYPGFNLSAIKAWMDGRQPLFPIIFQKKVAL